MPGPRAPTDWPDAWADALSDATLQRAGSAAIFQRGKAYARSGAVKVMAEDPLPEPALRAQVRGGKAYSTEVWIEDDTIAGDCDCPHADEGWFCKHQVATALVWRERLGGAVSAGNAAAPPDALHEFLHGLPADQLADKLLQLAGLDLTLRHELERWKMLSAIAEHSLARDNDTLARDTWAPTLATLQTARLGSHDRQREKAEALAQSRRQFALEPSVARYHQVLKAGKAAGDDGTLLRLKLLDQLQRREVAACCPSDPAAASPDRPGAQALEVTPDVTLRAAILASEDRWTDACEIVQPPAVCDAALLQRIAVHLHSHQREQALALLLRVFTAVMPHAVSPYGEALLLVRQICSHMAAQERAAWLAHLRLAHEARRHFVRELPVR